MEPINGYDLHVYCCDKAGIAPLTRGEWERNGKPTFEEYTGRKFYWEREKKE